MESDTVEGSVKPFSSFGAQTGIPIGLIQNNTNNTSMPKKGERLSEEAKKKISESRLGKPSWNKGLHLSEDHKQKLSGRVLSNETKQKMREARLGKPSWNKGLHFSEESKQKMREAKLGKKMSEEFRQKRSEIMKARWNDQEFKKDMSEKHSGENNYNFGKHLPEEQKKKLSKFAKNRTDGIYDKLLEANIGKKHTSETRTKMSESHAGDKCYNWKGGITPVYRHIRGRLEYKRWCADLLKKHDYTDAFTGHKGGLLSCHHIIPVNTLIKMYNIVDIEGALNCPLIWDLNNGLVILKYAHDKFHNFYGDDKNIYELTEAQIKELYTP